MAIRHEEVIRNLQELGFSEHEAAIYLVILKSGEASAGLVLDEVKLHREQVYRALKRLVDNGLLTFYSKHKRGYYSAVDPSVIVKRMKAKMELAESMQPYLRELHQKKPQIIRVGEGLDAYRAMFDDILTTVEQGGEYLVMSGVGQSFYDLTKDFYPKYAKLLAKKGITLRMTAFEGEDFASQMATQERIELRVLPGTYAVPVATVVYGNRVLIELMDLESPAIITIENQKIADGYRHTFETLWKLGKAVNNSMG